MSEYLLPYSGREVLNKLQAIDDLMNNSGNNKDCDIAATASGNNFVITDSSESPLLSLKADYEAQLINGYQLFDASKLKNPSFGEGYVKNADGSFSLGGATVTINDDGSITIDGSGEITGDAYFQYKYSHAEKLALVRGGAFYSNYNTTSSPYITFFIRAWGSIYSLSNGLECQGTFNHSQDSLNYEQAELIIAICAEKGNTITPCTVKPMIYQDGDGTWEPFTNKQPSSKALTLDVYGGQLLNYNSWKDIEGVVNGTAEFVNNGVKLTATSSDCYTHYAASHSRVLRIPAIPEKECTLSWKYTGPSGNTVYVFNEGSTTLARADATSEQLQFTAPADCEFITFRVGNMTADTTVVYEDIMLNVGSTPLSYESYKSKQSISIDKLMSEETINSKVQKIMTHLPTTTILNDGDAQVEVDYFKNTTNGKAVGKIFKANVDLQTEIENLKNTLTQSSTESTSIE